MLECKISCLVGTLFKLKIALPQTTLLQLYYAMAHPLLLYGITVWGSLYTSYFSTKTSTGRPI